MLSNYKLQMAKVKTKVDSSFETQGLLGETGRTNKSREKLGSAPELAS